MLGTPQGGVLSSLLFEVLMNTFMKRYQAKINGIADDNSDKRLS